MFFSSIIKLLAIFIFIYFLITLFKIVFRLGGALNRDRKDTNGAKKPEAGDKSSIIELKKDDYKVE
jgi:hypothetical protein